MKVYNSFCRFVEEKNQKLRIEIENLEKQIKNIVIFYSFYKESFNASNEQIEKFKLKLYKFKIF